LAIAAVKEVWTLEFAPALARAFPEARFLIIHRDPRAVLSSLIELADRNPDQAAHTVSYMRHWRKHVAVAHHLFGDPALSYRFASVRFEDLVARPKIELAAIYEFLGLTVSTDLSPAETSHTWLSNSSFAGAGAGIDVAASDRWRTYLSPDVIAAVDFHCEPEMRLLGYQPLDMRSEATEGVMRYVQEAHRRPGKWRSDAGDPTADMAWESRRREILNGRRASNAEVRRCFLFEDVLRAVADVPASTQKVSL
ncbi:MAG: sulfotransferase, partial [Nitratireductor sp.]